MAAWKRDCTFGPFTFYRGYGDRGGWLFMFYVNRFVIRIGVEPRFMP